MAATKKDATPIVAVEPPASKRGGGKRSTIPDADIKAAVELLDGGGWFSNGEQYHVENDDADVSKRKSRAQANSVAIKYRKAVVNSPLSSYESHDALVTRVWEIENEDGSGSGKFMFAVRVRPADKKDSDKDGDGDN